MATSAQKTADHAIRELMEVKHNEEVRTTRVHQLFADQQEALLREMDVRIQRAIAPMASLQHTSEVDRIEWRNITARYIYLINSTSSSIYSVISERTIVIVQYLYLYLWLQTDLIQTRIADCRCI